MIEVVTTEQMQNIDKQSIMDDYTVGFNYMKQAAQSIYDSIMEYNPSTKKDSFLIFCGKGNNGGDGLVLTRLLQNSGYSVHCLSVTKPENFTGEAQLAYEYFRDWDSRLHVIDRIDDIKELEATFIIDALLGTGSIGAPRGIYADCINFINSKYESTTIIAVDTPSGVNSNSGEVYNPAVKAHHTIALGFPKIGHFFYPARHNVKKMDIKPLEYPKEIVERNRSDIYIPQRDQILSSIPLRKQNGSKYDHGIVAMVCGSEGMCGAPTLAANGALKSGAGFVHLMIPSCITVPMSIKLTEPVLHSFPSTKNGTFSLEGFEQILEKAKKCNSLLIGCGLSCQEETQKLVRKLVAQSAVDVVLDADGINAYKNTVDTLKNHSQNLILTPHVREMERLLGKSLPLFPDQRIKTLTQFAGEHNCTVVLKGTPTIIVTPQGKGYILSVGNSALATAGTGDVLAGIIATLKAQGLSCENAALLGVTLHGMAGNYAAEDYSEYSVTASDVVNSLWKVFKNSQRL